MRVQLANCREEACEFDLRLDPATSELGYVEFTEPPDVEAAGRVEWRGQANYAVVGQLRARIKTACVRCLEPTIKELEREFDLTFVPAGSVPADERLPAEIDAPQVHDGTYEGEQLELDPVIEEQFHLSIPMRFLCSEDCPGLCPKCGTRRAEATCDCREDEGDPRLAVLKSLLQP